MTYVPTQPQITNTTGAYGETQQLPGSGSGPVAGEVVQQTLVPFGGGGGGSGTVTSVTAADASILVTGTDTVAPVLQTGALNVIAGNHPPQANWSNAGYKITDLAPGTASADAVIVGQVLQFSAAGQLAVGIGAGTGELFPIGTAGQALIVGGSDPSGLEWGNPTANSPTPPNDGPTNCLSQTVSRGLCTTSQALTSGIGVAHLIPLYAGQIIGHLNWMPGTTGVTGPENHWMAILDLSGDLLAITADNTTDAITGLTMQSLAIANIASGASSTYTVPTTGMYYIALNVTASGSMGTGPFAVASGNSTLCEVAPSLGKLFGAGTLTSPPSFPYTISNVSLTQYVRWFAALT